jgi:hypothetical protein
MEPVVEAFERAGIEFPLAAFADATVTQPDESDPTRPVNREFEFFQEAETFRTVNGNQYIPPLYLEKLFEMGIEKGMRGEHITTLDVAEQRLSHHPDLHKKHDEFQAQLCYWIYDDIPFGLVVYDDSHVIVRAYDDETGSVVVMADTDDPDAIEWAEGVVEEFREKSSSPSEFEELPEWMPEAEIET